MAAPEFVREIAVRVTQTGQAEVVRGLQDLRKEATGAAAATDKLTTAQEGGRRVIDRSAGEIRKLSTATDRLQRSIDPAYRDTLKLSNAQQLLERSVSNGLRTQSQANQILTALAQKHSYAAQAADILREAQLDSATAANRAAAANDNLGDSVGKTRTGFMGAIDTVGRYRTALVGLAGGVAIGVGALAGFVATARSTSREIATIGDEAARAGIGVKAFQELKFVAEQNRVGVDALTDGLKELNIRADEFILTGKGSGAEAFARLGYTATDLARKLQDPSALFTEIIGKLETLDRAAQIRIADEIFGGTGGEQFIQIIEEGEAGIRRTIEQANELGIVMDESMIAKADEIDKRFGVIATTVSTRLKGAIVDAAAAFQSFLDNFKSFEDRQDMSIQDRLGDVFAERQAIQDRIAEMQRQDAEGFGFFLNTNEIKLAEAQLKTLTDEAARLKDILDRRNGYPGLVGETAEAATAVQDVTAAANETGTALDYIGRNGGAAIDGGITKPSKEATAALREAEAARKALFSEADAAVARAFPFETAVVEAERLMAIVDDTSNGLSDLQREALRLEADQGFIDLSKAAEGATGKVAELRNTSVQASEDIGQAFASNVGSTILDIFTDAGSGADSFFDRVVSGFASIGKQSAEIGKNKLLETLFGKAAGYTTGAQAPGQRSVFPAGVSQAAGVAMSFSVPTPTAAMRQTSRQLAETVTESVSGNLLQSVLGAGKSREHITGPNTEFANSLTAMFAAAPASVQAVTRINSGFRSVARQAELFDNAVAKYGSVAAARKWVAPPGRSNHNSGNAADLGFGTGAAREWFHQNAGSYGLKFPMGHEPWHIEAGSTRGGSSTTTARALRQATSEGYLDAARRISTGSVSGVGGAYASTGGDPWVTDSGINMRAGPQQGLFGPRGQAGLGLLGAGAGAFFNGAQSGDPLSGALGGAMSGLGAASSIATLLPSLAGVAGPVGMAVGAAIGLAGSPRAGGKTRAKEHFEMARRFNNDRD